MELDIPDGVPVYITIGQPPLLAIPPQDPPGPIREPERPRGRVIKSLLAGVLLVGAFQAGRFLPRHADTASATQPTAASAGVPGVPEGSTAGEIPPVFRAQIAQPPQVIPPPGAAPAPAKGNAAGGRPGPAAASPQANPFGLQG